MAAFLAVGDAARGDAGIALRFDPSVRDTGMGGAGTAVFWGRDASDWANPALLGYHRGLLWHESDTQLVPDLADDVFFRSQRLTLGLWGLGFAWAGSPLGKLRLEAGSQFYTTDQGDVTAIETSFTDVESWGVGLSSSAVLIELTERSGHRVPWLRLVDFAVGISTRHLTRNRQVVSTQTGEFLEKYVSDESVRDRGWLIRLTPIDTFDPITAPLFGAAFTRLGLRLDAAYGSAVQGYNDGALRGDITNVYDPIARIPRTGWSARVAVGGPALLEGTPFERVGSWITPLVSVGYASDHSEETLLREGTRTTLFEIDQAGFELTLLRVFSIRRGNWQDLEGGIDGETTGWSLGLDVEGIGGFRVDRATRPQATTLDDVDREAWLVYVDVVGLARHFSR